MTLQPSRLRLDRPTERFHEYDRVIRELTSIPVPANFFDLEGLPDDMVPIIGAWRNADIWGTAFGRAHALACLLEATFFWRFRGTRLAFDRLSDMLRFDVNYSIDRVRNIITVAVNPTAGAVSGEQLDYASRAYARLAPLGWRVVVVIGDQVEYPVYVDAAILDTVHERFPWQEDS